MKAFPLICIAAIAAAACASPTPREEYERIDVARILGQRIPPIVARIREVAKTYRPGVLRFGTSEGATRMALGGDWDIFRFKFGDAGGSLIVLLSEADEQALVKYYTSPDLVGQRLAEGVRRNGLRSIDSLWGIRVQWGDGDAAPEFEPEECP